MTCSGGACQYGISSEGWKLPQCSWDNSNVASGMSLR